MTAASPLTTRRLSKWRRISLITAALMLVLLTAGFILLLHYWPFSQKEITQTLEETVPGTKVTISRFRSTYFVHPGATAEGLTFMRQKSPDGFPPLVSIQKLTIQANYHDLFLRPGYISRIVIDGLYVRIRPRGSSLSGNDNSPAIDASGTRTSVGEIVSSGAVLEIDRKEGSPLKFEIHNIHLNSVAVNESMSYTVSLQNALPPGEIQSTGKLGPWNSSDISQTPLSGHYRFEQANLSAFDGIQGILSSTGDFHGRLGQIQVVGNTSLPDFAIKEKGHLVNLQSHFEAEVNATNGDVKLTHVAATLQHTPLEIHGAISGKPPSSGKITSLDISSTEGHVQDILRPFVSAPEPPMSGPMRFRAHVVFASVDHPFYKKVKLTGDFAVNHGRFSSPQTQSSVDNLSEHSRGIKQAGDSEKIETELTSQVVLSDGVAKFSNLAMSVPGATAKMNGAFNIINEKVDFHGTLKTDVKLSDTTKGIKSLLLKPLDPLFKRKRHEGASIPVEMTGTYSHPHFGMEVVPKR